MIWTYRLGSEGENGSGSGSPSNASNGAPDPPAWEGASDGRVSSAARRATETTSGAHRAADSETASSREDDEDASSFEKARSSGVSTRETESRARRTDDFASTPAR